MEKRGRISNIQQGISNVQVEQPGRQETEVRRQESEWDGKTGERVEKHSTQGCPECPKRGRELKNILRRDVQNVQNGGES